MKLVGERRALAAAILAFYALCYFALSLAAPELSRAFAAIAVVYGLAFFALVAGYFWARWFAVGVSLFGVILAAMGVWQLGAEPVLMFVGATHLGATVALWGGSMAGPYDGQTAWRERFHMDDNAVQRLGRSVIRAGVSLPFVMLYAFRPGDGASLALGLVALGLTGIGLRALIQLRTWGVIALGAAGALLIGVAGTGLVAQGAELALQPALAGALLITASLPFAGPMLRWVAAR